MCQGLLPQEFKAIRQSQAWDFRQQRKVLFWRAVGGGGDSGEAVCSGKVDTPWNPLGYSLVFFLDWPPFFFFF